MYKDLHSLIEFFVIPNVRECRQNGLLRGADRTGAKYGGGIAQIEIIAFIAD